jgi:hypothetical protein
MKCMGQESMRSSPTTNVVECFNGNYFVVQPRSGLGLFAIYISMGFAHGYSH